MRVTAISAAVLALFTAGANATCTHTSGGGWNFRVYTGNKCTGKTLEYHGTNPLIGCSCFNIGSALNDKVNSFSFTGKYNINMFKDAGCKGGLLGSSGASWAVDATSSSGKQMSSFRICSYVS